MAKILVVDDQAYIRHLISQVVSLNGHEVHEISNAQSLREYLLSFQPDLIERLNH